MVVIIADSRHSVLHKFENKYLICGNLHLKQQFHNMLFSLLIQYVPNDAEVIICEWLLIWVADTEEGLECVPGRHNDQDKSFDVK